MDTPAKIVSSFQPGKVGKVGKVVSQLHSLNRLDFLSGNSEVPDIIHVVYFIYPAGKTLSILGKMLENTVGQTGINASGENGLCLVEETQLSKPTRRKRKPKEQSLESRAIFGTPN